MGKEDPSKPPTDPWEDFRPQMRTWECENCGRKIKRDADIETIDFVCSCGGKFVSTDKIERAKNDPDTEYGWILFLKTRHGTEKGIEQFLQIQSIILKKENEYEGGWVPFDVIKKHMNITFTKKKPSWDKLDNAKRTALQEKHRIKEEIPAIPVGNLRRLLDDMEGHHIVYKKKEKDLSASSPNKDRVFYRSNVMAAVRTLTDKGFKKEYSRLFIRNLELSKKLLFAENVLHRHGLVQEYQNDLKNWEDRKEKKG